MENVSVIWNDFKSSHKILNQITIIVLQIKSLYVIQS